MGIHYVNGELVGVEYIMIAAAWDAANNPHGTFVDYNPRVSCDGDPT